MGAVFSILCTVVFFSRKSFAEAVVMGVIMWFFSHIFASMGLFLIDKYTVFRAGCGAAAISGAVLAAVLMLRKDRLFRRNNRTGGHEFTVKEMLIPLIVSLLALPFVGQKNEYFGMGQDEGVYQTQAILFMNGDAKRQKDMIEYSELETDAEREAYTEALLTDLGGYDTKPEGYPDTVYDDSISPVSGIIHGIPTYSALLAAWGTMFGVEDMQDFENLLYVCMIFLVYFICGNLKLKKTTSACACAACAFAPIVIWVAKASLTEMLLALIPAVFLYFLTDDGESEHKWLSVIPVAVFCCYHVSVYTMIPIFVLIYGGMYVFTRERQYAVLMPVTIGGYLVSYYMMRHLQPFYTMNNYNPLFVGGIGVENITTVVTAASLAAFAAVIVFALILKKRTKKNFNTKVFCRKASVSKGFLLLLRLMLILPCVYIIARAVFKYGSWDEANHVALWGFIGNSGFVLSILGLVLGTVFVGYYAEKPSRLVVFLMFFYCILIYSAFLRYEIQYYYYFARYLAPFVPIMVIFSAAALDRFGRKLIIPATAVGLIYVRPYDTYLMTHKDDSRMEWSVLMDIADFVKPDDCVVISREYTQKLWLPLRSITGARVFPEDKNDADQLSRLSERYGKVYVITGEGLGEEDYTVMYSNKLHVIEDDLNNTGKWFPFSTEYYEAERDIRLYSFDKYRYIYTAEGDHLSMSGVSALESFFCWTDSEEVQIECGLAPDDYDITMELGCGLPFEGLGTDKVEVKLFLNGREIGTDTITPENNGRPLHFRADKKLVKDGENILTICAPLWSASVSNPADQRELGIAFSSLRFTSAS